MTPRLRVALTAPGMARLFLIQWLLVSVIVGALSVTIAVWWYGHTLATEIQNIERNVKELQARNRQLRVRAQRAGLDLSEVRMRQLPLEIDFAKQVQRLEGFSWTQFLNDLESAVPANVSLDSVVLNFKDSSIALRGAAKTLNGLDEFIKSLEDHPAFREVVLSRHEAKTLSAGKKTKGRRVIVFSLTVVYERVDRV